MAPPGSPAVLKPGGSNLELRREAMAGREQERELVESIVGELEPWNNSFQVPCPFAGATAAIEPETRYELKGFILSAVVSTPVFSKGVLALAYAPAVSVLGGALSRKTTLFRVIFNVTNVGYTMSYNFPAGNGLILRQNEPVYFLAACNAAAPAVFSGDFVLYVKKLEK